ncbi:MAG: hypothetical protein ACKODX_02160 [Gemmata sp.]
MPTLSPAARYAPTGDLWLLAAYFNPDRYRTKRANYDRFRAPLQGRIPLLTVECAFGSDAFELPPSPSVLQVRGRDVMWQKERLLNLSLAHLPPSCTKVAWLDADVLFENADWAVEAARRLDEFPVLQLFDRAVRLPRGALADDGTGDAYPGFAAMTARNPHLLLSGNFAAHGHTGFAWAARREVLAERGLYDACIAGSGDHMMAHAFAGDWTSACVDRIIGPANLHRDCFTQWCKSVYKKVRARVGCVPGSVLHLWHGEVADRRYVDRNRELAEFGFDPVNDIRVGPSGCWEWASNKPALQKWAREYFGQRREDGDGPSLKG